jgi:hypothetical protein
MTESAEGNRGRDIGLMATRVAGLGPDGPDHGR